VLLARWMGGFEYGIFVLVWTAMILAGNLSCLGFHTSVIRFVPEYREKSMLPELRGVLRASHLVVLAASTVFALLGVAGVYLLSGAIEPYYFVPFILGMICLPMIAMSDLLQGISRAHSWALAALAPTYIERPILILLFMAGGIFAGYAPNAETALIATILATWATTLVQLVRVNARIGRLL
ncbi:lipopolysaccharide biosynthesis protein, partial [Rhizobiaceae sp. 2RAB30]